MDRADAIHDFRNAWYAHLTKASDKHWIAYQTPRAVTSVFIVELLVDLLVSRKEIRYIYAIAHRIEHEQSNLTRRMRRWLDMRLVWIEHEDPAQAKGRPARKYYTLTDSGRKLALLAQAAKNHPNYPDWIDQIAAMQNRADG